MKKWLIPLIVLLVTLTSVYTWQGLAFNTTTASVPQKPQPKVLSKYETGPPTAQELLELVNKERAKVGVKPLAIYEPANKSAQYKADDMADKNYYGHTAPGSTRNNGLDYLDKLDGNHCSYISENLAGDQQTSWSTVYEKGEYGWMSSETHRKALLDAKYTSTGFGVSQEDDGDYFVVEHFCVAK